MANGMSSLMIGASGLKTAQAGLNTTAHNLANIDTDGYTRQQIGFADSTYMSLKTIGSPLSSTYGTGVGVNAIRRIRETFIDKAYRTENGRYGYYNSQYKAVEEIEDLFGEMQGVTYQESMTNLYTAINELSKEPASTVKRSSLMQNASAFLTRSDAVYQGLKDYQETLNEDVKNMVDTINDIANQIYKLNKEVAKIESAGKETANDVRDQRDALLDELSEYVRIDYYENENGETMVQVESVPMVTSAGVTEMSVRTADDNNLYIPTFPGYDRDVYTENALYGMNSKDQGSLKGLLLARGCVTVDYTDIPVEPDKVEEPQAVAQPTAVAKPTEVAEPDKNDTKYYTTGTFDQTAYDTDMAAYTQYQTDLAAYNTYLSDQAAYDDYLTQLDDYNTYLRDYELYEQKQSYYNKYIEPSPILCAIAGLDKLVNGICTNLDEVLCPTTTSVIDSNGNDLSFSRSDADWGSDAALYYKDANGKNIYIIPDSYEYESDQSVLYDTSGNAVNGVKSGMPTGTYYYKSNDVLYTHDALTGTQGTANGRTVYTFTSSNEVLYDADGNKIYPDSSSNGVNTFTVTQDTLYEYNSVIGQNGTTTTYNYSVLDEDKTDYGQDDDHTIGEGIFDREYTEEFIDVEINGTTYKVKNNANSNGLRSDYTLGNIIMNQETLQNVAKLPFTTRQGKEDMDRGQDLLDAWNADFASLNPESYAVGSFEEYYNNFISDFATIGKVLYNFVDHQQTMVNSYDDQRQQTTGVSSDEELQKMIKYQQSYNAASRYINVVSEMLEHLVTSLGNA